MSEIAREWEREESARKMIQIVELVRSVIPLMLNEVYEINLFEVYACAELDCVAQFFIIII